MPSDPVPRTWEVVYDLGHTAQVVTILPTAFGIASAGADGTLCLRGASGLSLRPPRLLPPITALLPVPDSTLVVVGTESGVFGLDLLSGSRVRLPGFEPDVQVTCGVRAGELLLVGCDDGTLREVLDAGGTRTLLRFDLPPASLVSSPDGSRLGFRLVDGRVGVADPTGIRWQVDRWAPQVGALALVADDLVVGGMTSDGGVVNLRGVLEVFGADGGLRAHREDLAPVQALLPGGDGVLALTLEGAVLEVTCDLDRRTLVGELPVGLGATTMVLDERGQLWVGLFDGTVTCPGDDLELRARSSGALAVTGDIDGRWLAATDLRTLAIWDRATLQLRARVDAAGICALTTVPGHGEDLVVATLDGRLEVRAAEDLTVVRGSVALPFAPELLGFVDDRVVAATADDLAVFRLDPFTPAGLEAELRDLVSGFARDGYAFRGAGWFSGLEVGLVGGVLHSVYDRDAGELHRSEQAKEEGLVRLWDGVGFVG